MHADDKIRFWQINDGPSDSATTNTRHGISAVPVCVKGITLRAGEDFAVTVDLVGTVELWDLSTGVSRTLRVCGIEAYESCARPVDGILTGAFYRGEHWEIYTWDVGIGETLWTTEIPNANPGVDSAISEDGNELVVVEYRRIQTWSTLTGKKIRSVKHNSSHPFSVTFDCSAIWICSEMLSVQGWSLEDLKPLAFDLYDMPSGLNTRFLRVRMSSRKRRSSGPLSGLRNPIGHGGTVDISSLLTKH